MKVRERGDEMSNGRRAEGFLGLMAAILLFTEKWRDNPTGKLISIALSAAGMLFVLLLRRQLARPWLEIYTITFLGIALILLVNLMSLS